MKDLRGTDVDEVVTSLGGTGKYQITKFLLSTLTWFSESYHGLAIVFIAKANSHFCSSPFAGNVTDNINHNQSGVEYGSCSITYSFNTSVEYNTTSCIYGYRYTEPKDMSIVSDFDLVCDDAQYADLSQTLLYLGGMIGSQTLTLASDKFGRKPVCLLSNFFCLVFGIITSFSTNIIMFLIIRLCLGITIQGTSLSAVTLATELFPASDRKIVGTAGIVIWGLLISSLSGVAYAFSMYNWRIVNLVISMGSAYSLIQYWLMDESLRWLIANNKIKKTTNLIKKISKVNGVDPLKTLELLNSQEMTSAENNCTETGGMLINGTKSEPNRQIEKKMKYSILDVCKSRRIGMSFIIMCFTWFTNSLVYYGIFLTSSALAGNMYLNFFLNAMVELPSAVIYWFTLDRIGRKKTSVLFHTIASVGLIAATILRYYEEGGDTLATLATVFSLIGKLGISGSFNVIYFYTPEIFPTNIRNVTLGASSSAARIGGMLAPFSSLLAKQISWAPGAIFGTCCIIVTGLALLLPETSGKEMPQTMEELESFYKTERV